MSKDKENYEYLKILEEMWNELKSYKDYVVKEVYVIEELKRVKEEICKK